MHICLVIDSKLPTHNYGGTERVVYWLGKALVEFGHQVTFLAQPSQVDFASVQVIDKSISLEKQIPDDVDIVHLHSGFELPYHLGYRVPICQTIHGNVRYPTTFHPNSIFVSKNHAHNHNAKAFVHNGLDPADYGPIDFQSNRTSFTFLAKAAWKVKNVRGAIKLAKLANSHIDILGGHRLNFKMGFRWTLSPQAKFYGMVDDVIKTQVLNKSRGLVFPVLWLEPFGVAVIESLYFGVPVFGTTYGSLPELINKDVGYLSNNINELASAMESWESYDRHEIHQWWSKNFTAQIMAVKYLEYYSSIISGKLLHSVPIKAEPVRVSKLLPWNDNH